MLSLIGAFYYLRIVKLMYFDDPKEGAVASGQPETADAGAAVGERPRAAAVRHRRLDADERLL